MVHPAAVGMKKLPAAFYRTDLGTEPVRDWLTSSKLTDRDRKIIGKDIAIVEFGWPVGMPTCEPLGYGLFEVRSDLPNNRITRVYWGIVSDRMLLLHGIIKKASSGLKAPHREVSTARTRLDDAKARVNK